MENDVIGWNGYVHIEEWNVIHEFGRMEDGRRSTRSMEGWREKYREVREGVQREVDGGRSTNEEVSTIDGGGGMGRGKSTLDGRRIIDGGVTIDGGR